MTATPQQQVGLLSFSRVADGIEAATHSKSSDPGSESLTKFLDLLKSLKEPMAMSCSYRDTNAKGSLFIPMDFDKLLDLIGSSSPPVPKPGTMSSRAILD